MSDLIVTNPELATDTGVPLKRRFVDQSDGTWAEKIAGTGGSGTAATQSLGAFQTGIALQTAATATGNGTTLATSGMAAGNVVVTGTFVGTVTFEYQDAAGNWNPLLLQLMGTTTLSSTATSASSWRIPASGIPAMRARVSAYTSGSITVTAFAENTDSTPAIQNIGMYERLDPVNDAVTNYPLGHNDTVISTATTTTIKAGAGIIRQIRVIGGTLGNVTAYDNTAGSGTLLVPTVTPAAGQILLEDAAFTTGLTIVTAAATLLVVTWR